MIYIFWTCANKEEAERIVHELLEKKLIACASLFLGVQSIYRWQGKIEQSVEVKVQLKTTSAFFDAIEKVILEKGSYKIPEIVQIEASKVSSSYLSWLENELILR